MKHIGIGWTLDQRSNEGGLALNLALQFARKGRQPSFAHVDAALDIDSMHRHLLSAALEEYRTSLADRPPGVTETLPFPVLQPFGDCFSRMPGPSAGNPDIGVACFEHSDFSPASLEKARNWPLIVTGSHWNSRVLRDLGMNNVLRCPPGIDPALFHPAPPADLFPGRFVIFSCAPLRFSKGQDLVIAAFRVFHQRHPEALLLCDWPFSTTYGLSEFSRSCHVDGPPCLEGDRVQVGPWLYRNGIPPDAVIDLSPLRDAERPTALRECKLAIFPARCAGEGNARILEAMACGIPTAIAANTGHLDLAGDHVYLLKDQQKLTCLANDPDRTDWGEIRVEELLAIMERVYERPDEAARKGQAAANFAKDWTWDRQAGRQLAAVDAVTAGKPAAGSAAEEGYGWGNCLHRAGRLREARDAYATALECEPGHIAARVDRANASRDLADFADAESDLNEALALDPANPVILQSLGNLYRVMGRLEESAASLQQALAMRETAALHWSLAYTLLLLGKYAQAWPHFEHRHAALGLRTASPHKARWDGRPVTAATLLILDEQGLGDTLQFLRFLPLIPRGPDARIIFAGKPAILPLVRRILPSADVYSWDKPLPRSQSWIPLMSLPARLGIDAPQDLPPPSAMPGLLVEEERVAAWRSRVRGNGNVPVVGLCWRGNPDFSGDAWRSPGLAALLPLLKKAEDVRFVSLQTGAGREEIRELGLEREIVDLGSLIEAEGKQVLDTLAALKSCDFIISSCTSIAHMAGLAGMPGCVMLSTRPDWRWMTERTDSPWYPNLRLIRQSTQGDWSRMAEEAAALLDASCSLHER